MDKVSGFGQLNIIDQKMMQGITANMQEGVDASAEAESLTSQIVSSTDTVNLSQASKSMMAGNMVDNLFVHTTREESRYTKGTLLGLQVHQKMNDSKQNAITSIMELAKLEYAAAETNGEKYKALKRAEKRIAYHQASEVVESAEETHLKEFKEGVEEKIEEATAPKGENGDPIESPVTESNGETATIPADTGATAADAAPLPTPGTGSESVDIALATPSIPAVSELAPSVPTSPGVDIVV